MTFKQKLMESIKGLKKPTPAMVHRAVAAIKPRLVDLEEYIEPPGDFPYGRRLIGDLGNEDIEVLVMNWASQIECAPHDHGASFGSFVVVAGKAHERRYSLDSKYKLQISSEYVHETGAIAHAPSGLIHSMYNPLQSRLVTLHVYAPPIVTMKIYDITRCMGCVVQNCGAWWPKNSEQLVTQFPLRSEVSSDGDSR